MVESTDRGVVDIGMEVLMYRVIYCKKRRKKAMSELWPIEEKRVRGMKQVWLYEEGKDVRGRWGHEDVR